MTILSRVAGRLAHLPAATHAVAVQRKISVTMPDGVVLLADRWYPVEQPTAPILLTRTPYGRIDLMARLLAERGYQIVQVSCRGTAGSGGEWVPFHDEQADGRAVLGWLEAQTWFIPQVATFGGSYFGLTQWAVAADPPDWLKAISPAVTTSSFRTLFYPGGSFALQTALGWIAGMELRDTPALLGLLKMAGQKRKLSAAYATAPIEEMDEAVTGRRIPAFQDWLEHDRPEDPWWAPLDFGRDLARIPPTSMVAGWYDVFLPDQLDDAKRLMAAGRDVRLTIGPWIHGSPPSIGAFLKDTLTWADVHLRGAEHDVPAVRVKVLGTRQWLDLPAWPPPATQTAFYLQPGGALTRERPLACDPSTYRYDPADPTPGIGGATLDSANAGAKDNRKIEARTDVLTFTTDVLIQDVTVIGEVTARLFVRSSLAHTDFFVRLCDVSPKGRSTNISDGILRLRPEDIELLPDGTGAVTIRMFPTAVRFARGHRIRLQVSSGAHPVYARNPGSGEPLGKATTFVPADQAIYHDPERASHVLLPLAHA